MSEREGWMPDTERLCMAFDLCDQAWDEIGDGEREPNDSWLDPLRAVVREAVEKALAEPRPEAPLNQRLYDLVRYQRHALHDSGLLTDEEFASLVLSGASSARRLEDYDKVRRRLAEQEARHRREVIEAKIDELNLNGCRDQHPTLIRIRELRAELSALDAPKRESR